MDTTFFMRPRGLAHHTCGDWASEHALHAHKLVIPLDAPVHLTWPSGRTVTLDAPALVPAHVAQAMGSQGQTLALFWEVEDELGRVVGANVDAPLTVLEGAAWWRGFAREVLDAGEEDGVDAILAAPVTRLGWSAEGARPMDARVAHAQRLLRASPETRLKLGEAARAVGLSESRLSHLFTREAGMPYRRYALWLRAHDALRRLLDGAPITQAALGAGFSDHAHLTRTMRALFGQPPSYVAG